MTEFDPATLPKLRAWQESFVPPVTDPDAYLWAHLDIPAAVLFAQVVTPTFIAVEGHVLRADRYDAGNLDQWRRAGTSVAGVESVVNELHLWDLFDGAGDDDGAVLDHLAQVIADSWRRVLREQFPDRAMTVEVTDAYGPTITAYTAGAAPG